MLATWKAEIRRMEAQDPPGQIVHETPISKITRAKWQKWNGGVVPVLEWLLCKHKALSSNPSPTEKKKK
jgi:hypothetical protein